MTSPRSWSLIALLALLPALTPVAAQAQPANRWIVSSSQLSATVALDAAGSLTVAASRSGRAVLSPAPAGLRTTTADLTTGLRFVSRVDRVVSEQYSMTTGKRRNRTVSANESRLAFATAGGARIDLVVRASADGVAYRYVVPGPVTVTGEASAFGVPATAQAWLLPYNAWYEADRIRTTAGNAAAGDYGNPSLFQVGQDYALLTESDVDGRYPGSKLRHAAGSGTYQVVLADEQLTSAGELRTPWRTAIIGDLATVSGSTMVDDLAPPSKIADTTWVKPGKVAWSWLSENSSPSDFERQKAYVDFAARNGWPYVLVDEGWSAAWAPELTRYARAKGVDILLWLHWTTLDTQAERDTLLPRIQGWGVKGVKLDFMESDSRERYQWYDAVLAKTAELHLMVNFHGSTIPHGLARTWPHVMTMEAVRGAENRPAAANNPVQAFTRNVVGSMDYTPVSLDVGTKEATVAHEVALPVVYESGWTHFADKPEAYQARPQALRFLDQVPTVWDDSRLVGGTPDTGTVMARRDGDRWFLGAISTGDARTVTAPLSFLGSGDWLVETVRDNTASTRGDVLRSSQVLRSTSTLSVAVPRNGGFAAVACPAQSGRTTCDRPIKQVPTTTLTVTPAQEFDAARGTSFDITASFTNTSSSALTDPALTVAAPAGWTSTGLSVRRGMLAPGETMTGRWTLRVGDQSPHGFVDVPVFAEFNAERTHVEKAVRVFVPPAVPSGTSFASDLPFMTEDNGWGPAERDRSNGENSGGDGAPLRVGGVVYAKGIGVHAASDISVYTGRRCSAFTAAIGLDDETTETGSVVFQVYGDGRLLHDSGVIREKGAARAVSVDVSGVRMLSLRVTDGGDGKNFDHADWAEARIACA
ncbi:glycoside hydrolase family 97 catalytic domain-containing protein [Umezawaea endophytica]|uniref:Glycoside hydrolase family 97 catalytic domain-containing protein n=1 Tax=Umezawaea endophytica TaxID=1654476 RepID=A0A9X2VM42_9PSEU|nr:glycoside hydrolase family 97 catalytic domain-containing protein [Umezawaea endophytica]MCS7479253.1 glycoside hydrolase family 97 catalytic domain-containing protein [Umezawaea endophytica]